MRSEILSSALTLAAIGAICATLVAVTHEVTNERIAENRRAYREASLRPILDGIDYEGELSDSRISIEPPHALPGKTPANIYRVYAGGQPIAAVFEVTATNGYAGPIRLLVGLKADGTVSRVRVLEHRETPGLGDQVEVSKSDWIETFSGRSLNNPPAARWEIAPDGGAFDQMSGASITSRAVVRAVRETLEFFAGNRETVFANRDKASDTGP